MKLLELIFCSLWIIVSYRFQHSYIVLGIEKQLFYKCSIVVPKYILHTGMLPAFVFCTLVSVYNCSAVRPQEHQLY